MTNREWLNSLTDEETAEVLASSICAHCNYAFNDRVLEFYQCRRPGDGRGCDSGIADWLKAEHEEDNNNA